MTDNFRASLLMVASMAFFALQDVTIKRVSDELSPGQVVMVIGGGAFLVLALYARVRRVPLLSRQILAPAVMLRNACEFFGAMSLVTALALIPLSLVTAIMQATPLLVTLGAALWFREAVGWRRWSAVAVGFAGVLVILRPGMAGFEPAALWAVAGAIALSMRDLATRALPREVQSLQVSAWAFAALVPSGLVMLPFGPPPGAGNPAIWAEAAVMVALGLVAYAALVAATRSGDISVVAPFRYSRVLFALGLGMAVFGETPDLPMLVGLAMVAGSGLYTLLREAQLARARRRTASAPPSPSNPAPL